MATGSRLAKSMTAFPSDRPPAGYTRFRTYPGEGRVLEAGTEFHLFVSGEESQLPPEIQLKRNYIFLRDVLLPDEIDMLQGRPLVVVAKAVSKGAQVTTYTIVGAPPIVGVDADSPAATLYLPNSYRAYETTSPP